MVRHTRIVSVVALLGVAALAGSCVSDRPPPTGITADLSGSTSDLSTQSGLLQCSKLPQSSVKQTIGPAGGTMLIGPHVFVVPAGALAAPVVIAAKTGGDDKGNAVYFKPAGLVFLTPAYLTLSYANCNTLGLTVSKEVAYTTDISLEILYYLSSWDDLSAQQVTARVYHFSTFAVAW